MDLVANTVSFSNEMTKASQIALTSTRSIQRSLTLVSTAAAGMAAGVVASMTEALSKTQDYAFEVQKAAAATGTSSEMFSKLAYSAKLSGTPVDTLRTSMERLARTAGNAMGGSRQAQQAFQAIGVSTKELNGPLKDVGNLTVEVAKRLDKYADSTNKTAIEQALFGRAGADMAPMLKQLATGFDTASKQASLFGVVVGDKTAAQAQQLHASMVQLESVSLGFGLRLLSGVAPALENVADKMVNIATSANGMRVVDTIARDVAGGVNALGTAMQFVANHATAVKDTLGLLAAVKATSFFISVGSSAAKAGKSIFDIGNVAVQMIGKWSGITALIPTIGGMTKAVQTQAWMMGTLATEEGVASAATYGLTQAWGGLLAVMAVPIVPVILAMAAAAGTFKLAIDSDVKSAAKLGDAALSWHDYWAAAIDNSVDRLKGMKELLLSFSISDMQKGWKDFISVPTYGQRVHMEANQRAAQQPNSSNAPAFTAPKIDAPVLPKGTAGTKVDEVAKKLKELQDAAKAATKALADVGKGPDVERQDAINAKSQKIIDDLNAALAAKGKHLNATQEAEIRASVATAENASSQRDFVAGVLKTTQQITAQTSAQDILTNAIGRGAAAMRQAQVESEFRTKYADASPEWKAANQGLIDQQKQARYAELAAADAGRNKTAIEGLTQQIDLQKALNAAVVAGRDAMNQSRLASEQAAIRKTYADRGDTNQTALDAELARNEELFRLKQGQSDLTKAASMDAARLYNDEANAIRDAAQAARDAGQPLSALRVSQAQKEAWDSYRDSIDKTTLAVGDVSDGVTVFFQQMSSQTTSAAQQIHDVLGNAFESLNSMLEKLMTGQKVKFSDFFRGIAGQVAKLSLQKGESAIASGILGGIGKKAPDATASALMTTNSLLTKSVDTQVSMSTSLLGILNAMRVPGPTITPSLGASQGLTLPVPNPGIGVSGFNSSALATAGVSPFLRMLGPIGAAFTPLLGPLFGGHFATGGDVTAGMAYDVGEMGRETFVPTQNGRIIPNSQLRGGSPTFHIDARGSNDTAQTEAAVHRAMSAWAPHVVSAAIHTQHDQNARLPSRRRS